MGRLPFNPSRMQGPETPAPSHAPPRLTVSQLAALIDRALRDGVPAGLKVVGEVGQFRERTHWYFDLKDADAVVSCVMWASAARKAGFVPHTGMQVVVTGRVEHYAKQGRTTFQVERIEPVGEGALDAELRRLVEELRGLGWLDEARKRPLPALPRRVAVITSRTGAALQDVLDTLRRRFPALEVGLVDVRVQGDGAAAEIAAAVHSVGRAHERLGVDVVLVTRGGGSREDLWAFNDRAVAGAIVRCPVPVVAAIGHETDTTLAELVADVRAATPTQAAMRIAPDADALRRQLSSHAGRMAYLAARAVRSRTDELANLMRHMRSGARAAVQARQGRLERASARLERHRPASLHARREAAVEALAVRLRAAAAAIVRDNRVEDAARRMRAAIRGRLARAGESVSTAARSLDLVAPDAVLRRGYSMTIGPGGEVVRSTGDVRPGDTVHTRLADGSFASVVQGGSGAHAPIRSARSAARPARRNGPEQPGLFGGG
ncbi:MAG: exodeoxyribonuclease VII large subunit [Phycisphaeraceae bacterium]|nr:exodeoxyribonuclease VII large subunit [Phycisphaeraceae bacterium]